MGQTTPFSNGNSNFRPKSCSLTEIWAKDKNLKWLLPFWFLVKVELYAQIEFSMCSCIGKPNFRCGGNFWMPGGVNKLRLWGYHVVVIARGCFSILLQHTPHTENCHSLGGNWLVCYPQKPIVPATSGSGAITHRLERPKSTWHNSHV